MDGKRLGKFTTYASAPAEAIPSFRNNHHLEDVLYFHRGFARTVACGGRLFFGQAEELFAAQPITRVILYDKTPTVVVGRYSWLTSSAHGSASRLPDALWHAGAATIAPEFETLEAAFVALSDVCVVYARSLAGIPGSKGV